MINDTLVLGRVCSRIVIGGFERECRQSTNNIRSLRYPDSAGGEKHVGEADREEEGEQEERDEELRQKGGGGWCHCDIFMNL